MRTKNAKVTLITLPLAFAGLALGVAPPSTKSSRDADFFLKGMDDARQRLVTGVFRASGTWFSERHDDNWRRDGEVDVFCAFDFVEDSLRFDRSQVYPADAAGPDKAERRASKYVRTPKESLFFWKDSPIIEVQPTGWQHGSYGIPFDVRLVGMSMWAEFLFGYRFEASCLALANDTVAEISEEPHGIQHITWLCDGDAQDVKRELWLNEQEGFTPVHSEVRYLDKTANQWSEPVSIGDATWEEKSGVWVPRTWTIEGHQEQGSVTHYSLSFDWEDVNLPVAPELFTADGMNARKGTLVVTYELGRPIVRETIGMPTFEHPQSAQTRSGAKLLHWKIVGVGCAILFSAAFWQLVRRYRHSTHKRSEL